MLFTNFHQQWNNFFYFILLKTKHLSININTHLKKEVNSFIKKMDTLFRKL